MKAFICYLFCCLTFIMACSPDDEEVTPTEDRPANILLIIADDLGKDAIKGYTEGIIKPNTPNFDEIRNNGIAFNNFWVYPTCTPTRASIITGKYGYRTGIKWAGDVLDPAEITLQQYIADNTNNAYTSAIIGKWHLSGNDGTVNPETYGIDHFAGLIRGATNDYYNWQLSEDGDGSLQTDYITTVLTDLSIDWVNQQTKPWFLWLAYNAPHTPFHAPPANMHNQGDLPPYQDGLDPLPYYMAAIEAMDYQVGRLLETLSAEERENTIILFLGDNGTPADVAQFPYTSSSAKGTLHQGGINVPLFIAGAGVTRAGTDDNLLTSTDLFATIAEIAGVSVSQIHDSRSFTSLLSQDVPVRDYQYAEMTSPTSDAWAISNNRFKLFVDANGNEELYDLQNDPYENDNLLNGPLDATATAAMAELEAELSSIRN